MIMAEGQITPQDIAEGAELDFKEEQEFWNTYKISDGSTLKVKLVLNGVRRLKKHDPDGQPIYIIRSQNVVRVLDVPKELRAKPKEQTFKPT